MKIHRGLLCIWVLCAPLLTRAGTLDFVRNDLGLDLSKGAFENSLTNFPNAVKVQTEETNFFLQIKVDWYRTDASVAYEKQHAQSHLEFGFSDGKLALIRIMNVALNSDKEEAAKSQAWLNNLLASFRRLDGKGYVRQDKDLRVSYEAFCSPMENFAARILIALPHQLTTSPQGRYPR